MLPQRNPNSEDAQTKGAAGKVRGVNRMERKHLAHPALSAVEERYEWLSFLGLLPVLDVSTVDPVLYHRFTAAAWPLRESSSVSRTALLQACGFGLEGPSFESDLILAALVRNEILEPIPSEPFCFRVRARNWTDPDSAYAPDQCSALVDAIRRGQSRRLRIRDEPDQRLRSRPLAESREDARRMEISSMCEMYEATWLELAKAIGGSSAEAIRNSIERSIQPMMRQLELPLVNNKNSDGEGEERCNK
jgi:hypothetical protein